MPQPDVVIYDREHPSPFETMFLLVALLGGAAILTLDGRVSSALSAALPAYVTVIFAAGLVVGAVTALVGLLVVRTIDGSLFEAAGLGLLVFLFVAYAGYALAYAQLHGLIQALFFVSMAAASAWRVVQIVLRIRGIRRALSSAATEIREGGDA